MKVLVTGISGFVGKNFAKKILDDKNEYVCLVRDGSKVDFLDKHSNVQIVRSDFSIYEMAKYIEDVDIVIHMIGQMGGYGIEKSQFEKTNCELTRDILQVCINANVKQFIYISTPGVQGFGKRLCLETEPYAPRNPYEETKVEAEKIVIDMLQETDVAYTILRPDFIYGPEDYRRIKMYKNIRDRKFVLTTSGKSHLHPTYVDDVVQGIVCAMGNTNSYNEIFNISAAEDIAVKDYLKVIADYFNVSLIHINIGYGLSCFFACIIDKMFRVLFKKEGFVSKNKIDFLAIDHSTSNEKAKKLIGYDPQYDFKTGFELTAQWCKNNNLL